MRNEKDEASKEQERDWDEKMSQIRDEEEKERKRLSEEHERLLSNKAKLRRGGERESDRRMSGRKK